MTANTFTYLDPGLGDTGRSWVACCITMEMKERLFCLNENVCLYRALSLFVFLFAFHLNVFNASLGDA
ncbi:hypothetical protein LY78DRAFT_353204 [Colletotrichum sublineola]|nr:hypothetical protein LY78DRAFT_353204 [Colletotrichum sublineola]